MSQRSFEGYRYGVPLEAEFYGNVYRAYGPSGAEVRLLEVKPEFAAHQELATTLLSRGKLLYNFEHAHAVRTHAVGRGEQGGLIVVTDAVPGRIRLQDLLGGVSETEMRALPKPMAVAVAAAMLEALAAAHDRSVVHGSLHPRSVSVDTRGTVKVDDFAMGRALATWSERDSAASFLKAFGGFLAPELAQGARPDASTDVYAAAVLVLAMATGRTAAVALAQGVLPSALTAVLARALDTNRLHRYANAKRLRDALKEAWKADGWPRATPEELGDYLEQRRSPAAARPETAGAKDLDEDLEKDTEDVLSFLGDIATPPPQAPELVNAVNSMLAELDDDDEETTSPVALATLALPDPPSRSTRAASADIALAALSELDDDTLNELAAGKEPAGKVAATGKVAERKRRDSAPLPGSPGHSPSENLAFAALSDKDDAASSGSISASIPASIPASGSASFSASSSTSRSRDSVTPLPEPIRPSSEDIAFAALSDLEDDEPAIQAVADKASSPALPGLDAARTSSPALPRPDAARTSSSALRPPDSSRTSSPALPGPASPAASPLPRDVPQTSSGKRSSRADSPTWKPTLSPPSLSAPPPPAAPAAAARADEPPRPPASPASKNRPASGRTAGQDPGASRSGKKTKRSAKSRSAGPAAPASPPAAAIQPPPDIDATDLMLSSPRRRGLGSLLWLVLVVAAAGTLVWVVRNQMAMREQAEEQAQANEAKQQELLRAHLAAQPKGGRIAVESEPGEAAVWMLLGRTPLQTEPFSASMIHELRLELDGYTPQDVRVAGANWRGEKDSPHAEVSAQLVPGAPARPLPAYPPEPPPEATQGLREGQGSIHVTSQPEGAQVWLLVGITPSVEVMATAGMEYELEVVKDGYLPGIIVVRAADWQKAGDQSVERSVTLQRQPKKR